MRNEMCFMDPRGWYMLSAEEVGTVRRTFEVDERTRRRFVPSSPYRKRYWTVPTPTLTKFRARATAGCMSITRPCA